MLTQQPNLHFVRLAQCTYTMGVKVEEELEQLVNKGNLEPV